MSLPDQFIPRHGSPPWSGDFALNWRARMRNATVALIPVYWTITSAGDAISIDRHSSTSQRRANFCQGTLSCDATLPEVPDSWGRKSIGKTLHAPAKPHTHEHTGGRLRLCRRHFRILRTPRAWVVRIYALRPPRAVQYCDLVCLPSLPLASWVASATSLSCTLLVQWCDRWGARGSSV